MAQFGRGQPHAPLYLRAPLVALVVAALAPPIHVVQADVLRPRPATHVVFLHGAPSVVPPRRAPQITVVQARLQPPRTRVIVGRTSPTVPPGPQGHIVLARSVARAGRAIVLRGGQPPAAAPVRAPPIHVVTVRGPARLGHVLQVHGAPSVVPPRLAPQITVVGQALARPLRPIARPAMVVQEHGGPSAPPIVGPPLQIHIVLVERVARPGQVVRGRGAPSVVPPRLPPQVTVISLAGTRPLRPIARSPMVVVRRGPPPAVVLPTPVPSIHVVLVERPPTRPTPARLWHGAPSVVPAALPRQPRVILVRRRPTPGHVIVLRTAGAVGVPELLVPLPGLFMPNPNDPWRKRLGDY